MKKIFYMFLLVLVGFTLSSCGKNTEISKNNAKQQVEQKEVVDNDIELKEVKNVEEELSNNNDEFKEIDDETGFDNDITSKSNIEQNNKDIEKSEKKLEKHYDKLSSVDIEELKSAKDCIKLNLSIPDKKQCIYKYEDYILGLANLKPKDCKKIVTKKNRYACINKVYFKIALDRKNIKYCSYIKDTNTKKICKNKINSYYESIKKQQEKEEEKKQQKQQILNTISTVESCSNLQKDEKITCIDKFVKQDKDLRYCDKLVGSYKNKCINNNWNDVLKYNLSQAVKTKNKSYCDKIGNKTWVQRCYMGIK